ncbi:nucleotidyltransferase family protein [Nitrospira sp. Kam-Ns4a]
MLDLAPEHLALIQRLLAARLPGRAVVAFGSRVRGCAKPRADLDLAVMGEERIPDLIQAELLADFEESDLPFRVDLVAWRDAPPSLRAVIEREGLEIQAAIAR